MINRPPLNTRNLLFTLMAFALVSLTFALSINAHATDGSSGCGPGWYIAKDESLVSSALRATTNGILFPVSTLGMTFGTSNCTQHKLVRTEKESLHFATMNYFELKSSIAKGDGEYLSAFATTIGCPESAQFEFNSKLKQNYDQIMPNSKVDPEKMLLEVYKIILTSPFLIQQCSLS